MKRPVNYQIQMLLWRVNNECSQKSFSHLEIIFLVFVDNHFTFHVTCEWWTNVTVLYHGIVYTMVQYWPKIPC